MNQILNQDHYGVKMLQRKPLVFFLLMCVTAIVIFSRASWILTAYQDYSFHQNASLCACEKCLMDYDPWFTELLKESPEPFLSTTNNVSMDTFNWWKGIQYDRRNYSYYNKTVDKVFHIFPTNLNFTRSSPDRCRTCAVVGNSGNLNGSHYGPLIDFHDIVIRINHSPTEGFERDVGNKTTYHVMFPNSFKNFDITTRLIFFPFKIYDLEWLIRSYTQRYKGRYLWSGPLKTKVSCMWPRVQNEVDTSALEDGQHVMILSPDFMKYVHHVWLNRKGRYPSTGFMTLILSFHLCDEVSVFGFGADKNGNWNHYFEPLKNERLKTGQHPGRHEYKYIEKLHEQKKNFFFRGW